MFAHADEPEAAVSDVKEGGVAQGDERRSRWRRTCDDMDAKDVGDGSSAAVETMVSCRLLGPKERRARALT